MIQQSQDEEESVCFQSYLLFCVHQVIKKDLMKQN